MKKLLFLLLILSIEYSIAQKTDTVPYAGIFMNSNDYKANKLSYVMNCDEATGKIKLNHFFSKGYIDVVTGDKKVRLAKDSIYGYKDCKQKDFRFYKEKDFEYQIVENKTMVIYIADEQAPSTTGKGIQLVPRFYFSVSPESAILPLTIKNLKRAFPNNHKFHDKLDTEITSDKDVCTYDDIHKMYKVNFLIQ